MSTPSKPRTFTVTPGGGQRLDPERPGKVTWPAHLVLTIPVTDRALLADLVAAAVNYLALGRDGRPFVWSTMGEVNEENEDTEQERPVPDAPWPEKWSEG